jgi:hypothetical protein
MNYSATSNWNNTINISSVKMSIICGISLIDWLFAGLRPHQEYFTYMEMHHCRWRAAKFRPMLSAQGLWAGRDLCHATPAVTRNLGFPGLLRWTIPFSRLLRHTRGCWGSILTHRSFLSHFALTLYIDINKGRIESRTGENNLRSSKQIKSPHSNDVKHLLKQVHHSLILSNHILWVL